MKKFLLAMLILSIIISALTACGSSEQEKSEKPNDTVPVTETAKSAETTEAENPFDLDESELYSIETDYCTLKYPLKWQNSTKTVITQDGAYSITFYALTSCGEVRLFDLIFGESESYRLGSLTTDAGTVDVHMESYEIDKTSVTEEDYLNCYFMEEDINVIINELSDDYGFVLE